MIDVADLHLSSMSKVDEALAARRSGDEGTAMGCFREALVLEKAAAESVCLEYELEPTRSVLCRSAATLALDCDELAEAVRLAHLGLGGNAPTGIAAELEEVLLRAQFLLDLRSRKMALCPDEAVLSLAGQSVGPGMIASHLFISRFECLQKMVQRAVERLSGLLYRDTGNPRVEHRVPIIMSTPQAGSFQVRIRLGGLSEQLALRGLTDPSPERVLGEVISCLDCIQSGDARGLKQHLGHGAYYTNFIGLVKRFAPDGRQVRSISLSRQDDGGPQGVCLQRTASGVRELLDAGVSHIGDDPVTIVGTLLAADEVARESSIRVVGETEKPQRITVPDGMMADIVKPYWGERVRVTATRESDRSLRLVDLEGEDEDGGTTQGLQLG